MLLHLSFDVLSF